MRNSFTLALQGDKTGDREQKRKDPSMNWNREGALSTFECLNVWEVAVIIS